MIEAEWWEYDDADEMADAVAGDIGFIVESAIDARGECLLAFPGGSHARAHLSRSLAEPRSLPWKRVTIIPGDERLVPVDSDLSNIKMQLRRPCCPTGARVYPIGD